MADNPEVEQNTEEVDIQDNVLQILEEFKPEWKPSKDMFTCGCGCGYVEESFFTFSDCGYYWIVRLCSDKICDKTCAFIKISADWIKYYSNIILSSPVIFVKYNHKHKIECWYATQKKKCLYKDYNPVQAI